MEGAIRKPYQGVINIMRFNWHFYVVSGVLSIMFLTAGVLLNKSMFWLFIPAAIGIVILTLSSLLVSFYVYDRSALYEFRWLRTFDKFETSKIVNIHAGFDETSAILKKNFPKASLQVFDFYDSKKHTEVSIERARKAYPPFEGTVKITTTKLPIAAMSADFIFNIFALHEVRNRNERIEFLKEQVAVMDNNGKVVVMEHLRDRPNFLAYNIGFFHFFSEREWTTNFQRAGLIIESKLKVTPFITIFILRKINGNTR